MNNLKINREYLAIRCEICHKKDYFNAVESICDRCNKYKELVILKNNDLVNLLNGNRTMLSWYLTRNIDNKYYFIGWFFSSVLVLGVCYKCYILGKPEEIAQFIGYILGFTIMILLYSMPIWFSILLIYDHYFKDDEVIVIYKTKKNIQ